MGMLRLIILLTGGFAVVSLLSVNPLAAVELPVVSVTIHPNGAVVTRAGLLPADDTTVTGLPAGLGAQSVRVWAEGLDSVPMQLTVKQPRHDHLDPQVERQREQLDAAIAAADARIAAAHQHARLLEAVLAPAPARLAGDPAPVIPSVQDQQALLTLVGDGRRNIAEALLAATIEKEKAEAERQRFVETLQAAIAQTQASASLALPSAAGRQVSISYHLNGATWEPRYELTIAGENRHLRRIVRVRWPEDEDLPAVPVQCMSRSVDFDPRIRPFQVPILAVQGALDSLADPRSPRFEERSEGEDFRVVGGDGVFMAIGAGGGVAGMFGSRTGGGKRRAIAKYGGSKQSESTVDVGLRWLKTQLRADGSIQGGESADVDTALAAMVYLGAGYDHRMPSKYKSTVVALIDWLKERDPSSLSLPAHAYSALALTEAYAMSNDPALQPLVVRTFTELARRQQGGEVTQWLSRSEFGGGPGILCWLAGAWKSAAASGAVDGSAGLRRVVALSGLLDVHRDREAARAARLWVDLLAGNKPHIELAEAQVIAARMPAWYRSGRLDLMYWYTLSAFQMGGQVWETINAVERDFLVANQNTEGWWETTHLGGPVATAAYANLCLQTYYRYSPARDALNGLNRDVDHWIDPADASQGWPIVWSIPSLSATAGSVTVVPLDGQALSGNLRLRAVPVLDPTVWREWETVNPYAEPLPRGALSVRYEGAELGSTTLAFVEPGAAFSIPLGAELQARVDREVEVTSDDGMRTRSVDTLIRFVLRAPPGWTGRVTVSEPLPRMIDDAIDFRLREPDLSGEALQKRIQRDPVWRDEVDLTHPKQIRWNLRYKPDIRPFSEYLP